MNPLVSILMTSYNREKYITEAIESVLSSNYKNFELIIVDDFSQDNTVNIIQEFADKDARISFYKNEVNLGQFANRNKAVGFAKGTYLKFFDSDDVMYDHLLQVTMDAMLKFPDAGIGIECIWENVKDNLPVLFSSREAYISYYFLGNNFLALGPSAVIFKRSLFEECGGFDEHIGILADTLLILKMAANSSVVGYASNLFYWRVHDEQVTIHQKNHYEMFLQRHTINSIILNGEVPVSPEEIQIIRQNYKNIFLRSIIRYVRIVKSPLKIWRMFKIIKIAPIDLVRAFSKNIIID